VVVAGLDLGLSLAEVCRTLYRRGWMEGTAGNVSARLDKSRILITASGRSKGELTRDDVVPVDLWSGHAEPADSFRPSAETVIHIALYRAVPSRGAVVHGHSPYATALTVAAARAVVPEDTEDQRGAAAAVSAWAVGRGLRAGAGAVPRHICGAVGGHGEQDTRPRRRPSPRLDEKTQVQALQRSQPLLPLTFDKTEKCTHDYVRHGTVRRTRLPLHTQGQFVDQPDRNLFGIITRQAIRRGSFNSLAELIARIDTYIGSWNEDTAPFKWTATADEIIAKVALLAATTGNSSPTTPSKGHSIRRH
jgi:hypothetical protein